MDDAKLFSTEDMREHSLTAREGPRAAAKWYIKTARIYRDSAISYSEQGNREWANKFIAAADDCLKRAKRIQKKQYNK